jgi:hypothetical protein
VSHSVSKLRLDPALARLCGVVAPDPHVLLKNADDLTVLWKQATRHGLRPLLARGLSAQGVALSTPIQEERLALSAHSLRLTQALIEIQQAFAAQNIRLLGYKGPALAALLHQNVALRESLDLDILVSAADLTCAAAALEQMGYVGDQHLTAKQDRHFRATASNFTFFRRETGVSVELHWQIALGYSGVRFDFEDLWKRRSRVDLGGDFIATFSLSDQLLVLALHGARHFWESLCWTADIAYLLRHPDLDLTWAWDRARSLHLTGVVSWALRLVHDCFGSDIPALPHEVSATSLDRALTLTYRRINADAVAPELTLSEHTAFAKLLGPASTQLLYFTRLLFTPGPTDWVERPLPDRLYFAYPMLRLSRIMRKSVRTAK